VVVAVALTAIVSAQLPSSGVIRMEWQALLNRANTWTGVQTFTGGCVGCGASPAGAGTELQYRLNGTTFGAVTGSAWDGADVTLPLTRVDNLSVLFDAGSEYRPVLNDAGDPTPRLDIGTSWDAIRTLAPVEIDAGIRLSQNYGSDSFPTQSGALVVAHSTLVAVGRNAANSDNIAIFGWGDVVDTLTVTPATQFTGLITALTALTTPILNPVAGVMTFYAGQATVPDVNFGPATSTSTDDGSDLTIHGGDSSDTEESAAGGVLYLRGGNNPIYQGGDLQLRGGEGVDTAHMGSIVLRVNGIHNWSFRESSGSFGPSTSGLVFRPDAGGGDNTSDIGASDARWRDGWFGRSVSVGAFIAAVTSPAVANIGANSCGTTAATIAGRDNAFAITVGATAGTDCRVTFDTTAPNTWACAFSNQTTGNIARQTAATTTTSDVSGTFVAGDVLIGVCFAR
jgi:hypothetical protein